MSWACFRLWFSLLTLVFFSSRLVDNFLDFKDATRATFSIAQMPSMVCWGPKRKHEDNSNVLCWWAVPVTFWVVGYLRSITYHSGPDEPLPITIVTLDLMRDTDDAALRQCTSSWEMVSGEFVELSVR